MKTRATVGSSESLFVLVHDDCSSPVLQAVFISSNEADQKQLIFNEELNMRNVCMDVWSGGRRTSCMSASAPGSRAALSGRSRAETGSLRRKRWSG